MNFINKSERQMQIDLGNLSRKVSQKLNSGIQYDAILEFIFESIGHILPFDRLSIALVDETKNHIKLIWVKSHIPIKNVNVGYTCSLIGSSLEKIITTGQPRIIEDLLEHAAAHPTSESTKLIIKEGIRSSLACPLQTNGKTIGVVFFSSVKPRCYNQSHVHAILEMINVFSLVIEYGQWRNQSNNEQSVAKSLSRILHDLKSPLSVMQGFIEASIEQEWFQQAGKEGRDTFSILLRNCRFMFELLNELAELNQLQRHGADLSMQKVNLVAFNVELESYGRMMAQNKNIKFLLEQESDLPEAVILDPIRIRQVLDNLFSNAVKYSYGGTEIVFRVQCEKQRLMFSVLDHGLGIAANETPKLFTEFGKTSTRPTAGESSTGLGLAIAKTIVEQHGGQIFAESQLGQGSVFRFYIPLVTPTLSDGD